MTLFKTILATTCVAVCCLGNNYPAQAGNHCPALAADLYESAMDEVNASPTLWASYRELDKYVLRKRGCSDAIPIYLLNTSELRLNAI